MSERAASLVLAIAVLWSPPPALTVSAAISLADVLEEVATGYAGSGGGPVRFNFAASNTLARQIVNGAPVDVFISADERQMDVAAAALIAGSRRIIAANQLAVAARPERARAVADGFPRASPAIRRLALGDPAAVPAGVYARAYLERLGLWTAFEPRIVRLPNVRAALGAVEAGSADAAIVYVTDVRRASEAAIALRVPFEQAPAIHYPAAIVARTRLQREAERFVSFLVTAESRAIFARHGFRPPPTD